MCLVLTNPVEILAVQLVKQGINAGGFCTGHPSNYYLLLSNPYIVLVQWQLFSWYSGSSCPGTVVVLVPVQR